MGLMDKITEQKIQSAMQRGEFDNLPGAGKPIQWKDNPLAPEDQKLGFDLLQNNGFTLPWIEKGNEMRAERQAFRTALRGWCRSFQEAGRQTAAPPAALIERLERLNRMIMDYNNNVPVETLQVPFMDMNRELAVIDKDLPEIC